MSVIFSEADKLFNKQNLTDKQLEVFEDSEKQETQELTKSKKAKYKIEVMFPFIRKRNQPLACAVSVFKSGGKLHGGGDEMLFICRNEKDAKVGCGKPLIGNPLLGTLGNGDYITVYYCDTCKKHVNRELLSNTFLYKLPVKTIANNIYKLFRDLNSDADIYLKHVKIDIKKATLDGQKGMEKVPRMVEYAIYTLENIIKDGTEGSIVKKIENFLTS